MILNYTRLNVARRSCFNTLQVSSYRQIKINHISTHTSASTTRTRIPPSRRCFVSTTPANTNTSAAGTSAPATAPSTATQSPAIHSAAAPSAASQRDSTGSTTVPSSPSSPGLPYDISGKIQQQTVSADEEGAACPDVLSQYEEYTLPHPTWTHEQLVAVHPVHRALESTLDQLAYYTIKTMRFNFDWMSGWIFGVPTANKAINRIIFLETVAGVPGSIAATQRHLASLRRMRRDSGWINTLLAEAENERMHLLTALQLRQPGNFMKAVVFVTQGIFFNFFFVAYLLSPRYCHRLVGYLEEEAVKTYTEIIKLMDGGFMEELKNQKIPEFSRKYWKLGPQADMREMILAIRADEDHHREGK